MEAIERSTYPLRLCESCSFCRSSVALSLRVVPRPGGEYERPFSPRRQERQGGGVRGSESREAGRKNSSLGSLGS